MWHQWFNLNVVKLREYIVRKENKNNDFIQQYLLFRVSIWRAFESTMTWFITTSGWANNRNIFFGGLYLSIVTIYYNSTICKQHHTSVQFTYLSILQWNGVNKPLSITILQRGKTDHKYGFIQKGRVEMVMFIYSCCSQKWVMSFQEDKPLERALISLPLKFWVWEMCHFNRGGEGGYNLFCMTCQLWTKYFPGS